MGDHETEDRCSRCGCTESFEDNCGFMSKPMRWCSQCGYLMGELDELKEQISNDLGVYVFESNM